MRVTETVPLSDQPQQIDTALDRVGYALAEAIQQIAAKILHVIRAVFEGYICFKDTIVPFIGACSLIWTLLVVQVVVEAISWVGEQLYHLIIRTKTAAVKITAERAAENAE